MKKQCGFISVSTEFVLFTFILVFIGRASAANLIRTCHHHNWFHFILFSKIFESDRQFHNIYIKFQFISCFNRLLRIPRNVFYGSFSTKCLYLLSLSQIRETCPVNLVLHHLLPPQLLGESYSFWVISLHNFLHLRDTFTLCPKFSRVVHEFGLPWMCVCRIKVFPDTEHCERNFRNRKEELLKLKLLNLKLSGRSKISETCKWALLTLRRITGLDLI